MNDEKILEMDGKNAMNFWRKYKNILFALVEVEGWMRE